MDKFDVVWAVEAKLADSPELLERFKWLLKVWNTNDDRSFEAFDQTKPHGANYDPEKDRCKFCDERRDNCNCDPDADGNAPFSCSNCGHADQEVEFWPADGNPAEHVCPRCLSEQCFPVGEQDDDNK